MSQLDFINKIMEGKKELLLEVSSKIWDYAELPYAEFKSAKLLSQVLEQEGFAIEMGVAQIPTAFMATYGQGKPVMGFLGEFDALDALSQVAGSPVQQPIAQGCPGHGCGHNALGAGSLGAALAVKEYLKASQLPGRVIYFGCAAEEGAGSKQFMARAGLFDQVDFVYTWHPADKNEVQSTRSVAIMGANFRFKGVTAHAGSSPHLGRSALDAAELMSVGVNYLREHMPDQARIHYAYSDVGGVSPNVVQDRAAVKYEVRSPKVSQVKELFDRVVKVANGAALMTETTMEFEITMAFSDYIANAPLAEIANEAFLEVGPPQWSEEDVQLAKAFMATFNQSTKDAMVESITEEYGVAQAMEILERPLDSQVHPFDPKNKKYASGSTDVGDVAYAVPTINFNVATAFMGNVGHTWQMTGQSGSNLADKGLVIAAKVMALSALKTMDRPEVVEQAKLFTQRQNGGSYQCPLPDYVKPPIGTY